MGIATSRSGVPGTGAGLTLSEPRLKCAAERGVATGAGDVREVLDGGL